MKTPQNILSEVDDMNNSKIDYSDLPPMTEEERKTAKLYYKDFLDKLPPAMVNELIKQRLSETREIDKLPVETTSTP